VAAGAGDVDGPTKILHLGRAYAAYRDRFCRPDSSGRTPPPGTYRTMMQRQRALTSQVCAPVAAGDRSQSQAQTNQSSARAAPTGTALAAFEEYKRTRPFQVQLFGRLLLVDVAMALFDVEPKSAVNADDTDLICTLSKYMEAIAGTGRSHANDAGPERTRELARLQRQLLFLLTPLKTATNKHGLGQPVWLLEGSPPMKHTDIVWL